MITLEDRVSSLPPVCLPGTNASLSGTLSVSLADQATKGLTETQKQRVFKLAPGSMRQNPSPLHPVAAPEELPVGLGTGDLFSCPNNQADEDIRSGPWTCRKAASETDWCVDLDLLVQQLSWPGCETMPALFDL